MGAFRQALSWISGKVNGTEHRILIDTGASVGVTPEVAEMSTYKSDKEIFLDGAIRRYRKLVLVEYEFNGITLEREAAISDKHKDFQGIISPWNPKDKQENELFVPMFERKLNPKILL